MQLSAVIGVNLPLSHNRQHFALCRKGKLSHYRYRFLESFCLQNQYGIAVFIVMKDHFLNGAL